MSKPTVTTVNANTAPPKSPAQPKPTNLSPNQFKVQSPSVTSTTALGGALSPGSVVAKVTAKTTTASVECPSPNQLAPGSTLQHPRGGSNSVTTPGDGSNALPVIGKLATDLSIVKQRLTDDGKTYTVGEGTVNTSGPRSSAAPVASSGGATPVAPRSAASVAPPSSPASVTSPGSTASVAASSDAVTNSVGP